MSSKIALVDMDHTIADYELSLMRDMRQMACSQAERKGNYV